MNKDTGQLKRWEDLTPEERASGKWIKLNRAQRRSKNSHLRTAQKAATRGAPVPAASPSSKALKRVQNG